jgi:hypothetical protein
LGLYLPAVPSETEYFRGPMLVYSSFVSCNQTLCVCGISVCVRVCVCVLCVCMRARACVREEKKGRRKMVGVEGEAQG